MAELTYQPVGMTAPDGPSPPAGFHPLRVATGLGHGPSVFHAASEALGAWRMHRGLGLRVDADGQQAALGVELELRFGPLRAPCRVVWTVREERRVGFAYGTLVGHPERGEEAFVVEWLPDDSVRLTVSALSTPAAWYVRAAGPLGRGAQRLIARGYGWSLRRAAR